MKGWKVGIASLRLIPIGGLTVGLAGTSAVTLCDPSIKEHEKQINDVLAKYYASLKEDEASGEVVKESPKIDKPIKAFEQVSSDLTNAKAAVEKYYRYRAKEVLEEYYEAAQSKGEKVPVVEKVEEVPTKALEQRKSITISPRKPKPKTISAAEAFKTIPNSSANFCVPYVIVGGGTAAWSAVQAIYARDKNASVLIISDEAYAPYNRTPLSKERWDSKDEDLTYLDFMGRKRHLLYKYEPAVAEGGRSSMLLNSSVVKLDIGSKTLTTNEGTEIQYQKLLIATGGKPRLLNEISQDFSTPAMADRVLTFRTIDDFKALDALTRDPLTKKLTVFGGGFLGLELSSSLHRLSKDRDFEVELVFPEPGPLYKLIPRYLSEFLGYKLKSAGIDLKSSTIITGREKPEQPEDSVLRLESMSFEKGIMETNGLVVAIGIEPQVKLAQEAGLEIDERNGGIQVNSELVACQDVYVAGDVASFWDPSLGRRRVEHWDHALVSGRIAGENMAGGESRYGLQSMFWCDLSSIGVQFEAVGLQSSKLETVGVWNLDEEPKFGRFPGSFSRNKYGSGVVWYLDGNRVVGALLWNMPHKALKEARKVIDDKTKLTSDEELSKLIELPESKHKFVISREESR